MFVILLNIKNLYPILTRAEKKVADIILKDAIGVTKCTVHEIAEKAQVAPSAVIRFCKKTGVEGLSGLKRALIEEMTKRDVNTEQLLPITTADTIENIFEKTFTFSAMALKDTLQMINFAEVESIIKKIIAAKRVVFFGVGTSSVIAIDAHYRFSQMGILSSYCSDVLFMNVTAANLTKEDLAVFISHSGQTKATVDAMRKAKNSGATVVAISSFSQSILARECDFAMIAFSDENNYPIEAVSAGVAHMCIVDALMLSIAKHKYKDLPVYIKERNNVLKNIRY